MKIILEKIFLFISSFIPLYVLIIIKETIEIINTNLSFNATNSIMLCFNFLLIVIGIIGIVMNFKNKQTKTVKVLSCVNITCQNFLPYFPLFVLFAIAFELELVSMSVVYFIVLIMIGVVYIRNDMFYINPFLNILGFGTYEITYQINNEVLSEKIFSLTRPKNIIAINNCFSKNI